jgi:SAM-dependent methyltransferase
MTSEPHALHEPSAWVVRFAHLVRPHGRVLDLACGSGRHARHFAARGHAVLAVDRDAGAVASLRGVANVEARIDDLERGRWPFAGSTFDGIVVANYLHRPLLPHLLEALAADGALIYETFAEGNEAFGRPSNPAFLLKRDELLRAVADRLLVAAFEQGSVARPGGPAVVQRLAAVGPARRWPPALDADAGATPRRETE